jgi:hypothetical protein
MCNGEIARSRVAIRAILVPNNLRQNQKYGISVKLPIIAAGSRRVAS